MVDWFKLLKSPFSDDRRTHQPTSSGVLTRRLVGNLAVPSGSIVLGEIQWPPDLAVENIPTPAAKVFVETWHNRVATLILKFGPSKDASAKRVIGRIDIDSAKMLVADKDAVAAHWAYVGPDRIGVLSPEVEDALKRRFKLKMRRINPVRSEIVGPVSTMLEQEILAFVPTLHPRYEKYPVFAFYVQTNNTFERANFMEDDWAFLPVGNAPKPEMFVCTTGMGTGSFDVECEFENDVPQSVKVTFMRFDEA